MLSVATSDVLSILEIPATGQIQSKQTILEVFKCEKSANLAHYFPYDVKLRLLAHSRSFLANQKARNAIVGAENLLINTDRPIVIISLFMFP